MTRELSCPVGIIGAGPAGLTAAYALTKCGVPVIVAEADPAYVGGISKTAQYKGFLFDVGGHRFYSKSAEINTLWQELLPDDMLDRPRRSRIYYRGKFFDYPLKPLDAFLKLGPLEAARCVSSYAKAKLFPIQPAETFQQWVSNQFGSRLFQIFFQSYTEKVWGMRCDEIAASWAAQRIKGLSLGKAIKNAFFGSGPRTDSGATIKTLINSFKYPRRGPGMLWDACAAKVKARGGKILMGCPVTGARYDAATGVWTVSHRTPDGTTAQFQASHLVSSAAISDLVPNLDPKPSATAITAARSLRYREFLTVALILKARQMFPDNWIYIHDPSVKVGRIQNYKAWSPEMVPDPALYCYGLEYFCFEHDRLWCSPDEDLVRLAWQEVLKLGLASAGDLVDGCVVRQKKAYPVYDHDYARHIASVREELERNFPTLHLVGRNGMHFYNNQDHSMMTALLAADNILAGKRLHNLWSVTEDAEYIEAGSAGSQRLLAALQVAQ